MLGRQAHAAPSDSAEGDSALNAGVIEDGIRTDTGRGTPLGAIVSPVLANVYLHDAFDLWFQQKGRQRIAGGETIAIRHADDRVIGLQHRSDAERLLQDLRHRLARFGLELHSRKTRLLEFGRFAKANRNARGIGKPTSFDFPGMTHYCATTLKGGFRVGRKPSRTRVNRTLKRIKEALRGQWHVDERELAAWLGRVPRGWLNYYAVSGSGKLLRAFRHPLRRLVLRALRRRSQADRTSWDRIDPLIDPSWPRIAILHPWPARRLVVSTRGGSRMR